MTIETLNTMNKRYHNITKGITARPRSKRLREAGGYYTAIGVGKDSSNAGQTVVEGHLDSLWEEILDSNTGEVVGMKALHDIWVQDANEGLVNISSAIRNIPLINIGTEEDPVWTVDISAHLIKTDEAYAEGQSAPLPTDNLVYSALRAKEMFLDDDDIIKTAAHYTTLDTVRPASTDAVVYSAAAADEAFLSALENDSAQGIITFLQGIRFGNYVASVSGGSVYIDNDDLWHIEADYFHVRRKLTAEEIEVQRTTHVGGKVINSPASILCSRVETYSNYYRCYFRQSDADGRKLYNQYVVNDLALVQTFNLANNSGNLSNHYLWRKVVGVGTDYIDLSRKSGEYASGSDAPLAGDYIVQLGNTSDASRQGAIIDASYDASESTPRKVPYIRVYSGIRSFSLPTPVVDINPASSIFTGSFITNTGANVYTYMHDIYDYAHTTLADGITTAQNTASSANTAASNAVSTASNALTAANSASSKADTAKDTADSAASQASTNASAIASLGDRVTAIAGRFNSQGHLTELSSYVLTSTLASYNTARFNDDLSLKNTSGLVTTAEYASLMSTYLSENGYINSTAGLVVTSGNGSNAFANMFASSVTSNGIAKTAEIQTWVNGQISGITLTADKINFNGYTIINSHFQVDNSGNLKLFGAIEAMNTVYTESGVNYALRAVGNTYLYGNLYQAAGSAGSTILSATKTSIAGTTKLTLSSSTEIAIVSSGSITLEGRLSLFVKVVNTGTAFSLADNSTYHYFLMTQSSALTFNLGTPTDGQIIMVKQCVGNVTLSGTIRKGSATVSTYLIGDGKTAILVGCAAGWSLTLTSAL